MKYKSIYFNYYNMYKINKLYKYKFVYRTEYNGNYVGSLYRVCDIMTL